MLSENSPEELAVVALRPVADSDLGQLFDQQRDPESVSMAAFTPDDPNDRAAFDAKMARIRARPDVTLCAVTYDDQLVGSISAFVLEGQTEVTYWIDRSVWGHGIASRALELLLDLVPTRPLHARAASDNTRSLRVLEKAGFKVIGTRTPMHLLGTAKSRKRFCVRTNVRRSRAPDPAQRPEPCPQPQ